MNKDDLKEINFFLELLKQSFEKGKKDGNFLQRQGIKVLDTRLDKIQAKLEEEIRNG